MTKLRERRREVSSLIEGGFLISRQRFLKLGGAGLLAGMLVLFGAAGCGGSGGGGDNGGGRNGNGGNENDDRGGEDKGENDD